MSFDKVEVRVFSGPDQVQVGSNTEPDLIVINNGPKGDPGSAATIAVGTTTTLSPGSSATVVNAGTSSAAVFNFGIPTGATGATGAAGPNSVTSATTSDGTASLSVASVQVYPSGSITLASTNSGGVVILSGQAATDARMIAFPNSSGTIALTSQLPTLGTNVGTFLATPSSANLAAAVTDETGSGSLVFATSPSLTSPTIGTSATFNATTYTYGAGAAAAHRDSLDIASADLQIESLFTLLTLQESDSGVFTANLGTATSSQDGDSLSLSATTANQRPNVYRFRNWNRNPAVSGTANAVIPVRLACAGNIYHLGSGANGASFRCGFGMVNGSSAVAADANATTGRGFGWRIAWNSSTSKLEFNLWAHNGTTYVEGTGIDTGLGAGNLDGFFNIIVRLASDGTVTAHTWFGSSTSSSSVPSATPSVTLAGGPTSGSFANLGTPAWVVAAHSTNAPSSGNSIIARISNRKLYIG